MLAKCHIGLDEYFDDLVDDYKQHTHNDEPLALGHLESCHLTTSCSVC